MPDKIDLPTKKKLSPDWFVRGLLTRIGDTFDKLTGRNWKPSSSLATSKLSEKLKKLLDSEVEDLGVRGKFVPHIINLKMQWNKFSTDSTEALKNFENELLAAAIDHINDNRYHTHAPLKIEVKPDYFTEGVRLTASFDKFAEEEDEAGVKVTMPSMELKNLPPLPAEIAAPEGESYAAEFTYNNKQKSVELKFAAGKRLSVGRTRENDLSIEDASVSKIHATLMVNAENKLLVADTGSTNGTFVGGERIAYGRAFAVGESGRVKFGNVEVFFRRMPKATDFVIEEDYEPNESVDTKEDYALEEELLHTQPVIGNK